MSKKIPQSSVEYQSRNYCQCDFCCSRRSLNAKKLGVNELISCHTRGEFQNGCHCSHHDGVSRTNFDKRDDNISFNPDYPSAVNQTALNAAIGRNGVPSGNQYTIFQGPVKGLPKSHNSGEEPSNQKRSEEDVMKELDHLERLLILEHKERVAASLEADRLNTLRTTKKEARPLPLPPGYTASSEMMPNVSSDGVALQTGHGGTFNNNSDFSSSGNIPKRVTVQEAFELAHHCPVATVAQCDASHRLQDALNGVRMVAMDPTNPNNREALRDILQANRVHPPPASTAISSIPRAEPGVKEDMTQNTKIGSLGTEFKHTLASIRTSQHHPQGAGVIWASTSGKTPKVLHKDADKTVAAPLSYNETASSAYPTESLKKKVAYVT